MVLIFVSILLNLIALIEEDTLILLDRENFILYKLSTKGGECKKVYDLFGLPEIIEKDVPIDKSVVNRIVCMDIVTYTVIKRHPNFYDDTFKGVEVIDYRKRDSEKPVLFELSPDKIKWEKWSLKKLAEYGVNLFPDGTRIRNLECAYANKTIAIRIKEADYEYIIKESF